MDPISLDSYASLSPQWGPDQSPLLFDPSQHLDPLTDSSSISSRSVSPFESADLTDLVFSSEDNPVKPAAASIQLLSQTAVCSCVFTTPPITVQPARLSAAILSEKLQSFLLALFNAYYTTLRAFTPTFKAVKQYQETECSLQIAVDYRNAIEYCIRFNQSPMDLKLHSFLLRSVNRYILAYLVESLKNNPGVHVKAFREDTLLFAWLSSLRLQQAIPDFKFLAKEKPLCAFLFDVFFKYYSYEGFSLEDIYSSRRRVIYDEHKLYQRAIELYFHSPDQYRKDPAFSSLSPDILRFLLTYFEEIGFQDRIKQKYTPPAETAAATEPPLFLQAPSAPLPIVEASHSNDEDISFLTELFSKYYQSRNDFKTVYRFNSHRYYRFETFIPYKNTLEYCVLLDKDPATLDSSILPFPAPPSSCFPALKAVIAILKQNSLVESIKTKAFADDALLGFWVQSPKLQARFPDLNKLHHITINSIRKLLKFFTCYYTSGKRLEIGIVAHKIELYKNKLELYFLAPDAVSLDPRCKFKALSADVLHFLILGLESMGYKDKINSKIQVKQKRSSGVKNQGKKRKRV